MENQSNEMVEEILRTIEAERVKQRVRPLAVCRKAKINGGCYSRMMRERGGRISSIAAIMDALGLELVAFPKDASSSLLKYGVGSWTPAILKGNVKGQKCSVCGMVHPVVIGAYPMRYCPSCGSYNGALETA
jgi:hypothetical protein